LKPNGFGSYTLTTGPSWTSFEELRTAGNAGLEAIPSHSVATLHCKGGDFRILREADFQLLLGLASDVHRLASGARFIAQVARIAVKHPDEEHLRLLLESASFIAESPELPQRDGHAPFEFIRGEGDSTEDDFDLVASEIPRPRW
jgi:hypothetical protein